MPPEIDMAAIKALSRDERIALAEAIWESVEEEAEPGELTEAQKAELDRRIAYADAHPEERIPWEVVLAEAEARWKK